VEHELPRNLAARGGVGDLDRVRRRCVHRPLRRWRVVERRGWWEYEYFECEYLEYGYFEYEYFEYEYEYEYEHEYEWRGRWRWDGWK
jgi:hypothetical protein